MSGELIYVATENFYGLILFYHSKDRYLTHINLSNITNPPASLSPVPFLPACDKTLSLVRRCVTAGQTLVPASKAALEFLGEQLAFHVLTGKPLNQYQLETPRAPQA